MRFNRYASKCRECPLRDKTRVWSEGPERGSLVFLGEAPGREEDEAGRPFVGSSGAFLNSALHVADVLRHQCWVMNVLPCRPPSNDIGSFEAQKAKEQCASGLSQELESLKERGYSTIVALGATAMHALGIEGSVMKNRGSVYEARGFVVVPTLHPAALLREQTRKRDKTKGSYKYIFFSDIGKAKKIAQEGWKPPEERFVLQPTVEEIEEFVEGALSSKALVACDIETSGKGSESELVVVGFALDGESGLSVPFYRHGKVPMWSNGSAKRVTDALWRLFKEGSFVFQYAPFDVPFLVNHGIAPKELLYNVTHDTLVLHSVLNPELPHRLDFIVSEFGFTPYWKEEFRSRDGSIFNMDDTTLRTYNLRDAVVLHQVLRPMLDELKKVELEQIYFEERMRMLPAVMKMKMNGLELEPKRLKILKAALSEEQAEVEEELRRISSVPGAFNFDSGDDLRYLLYGERPAKFDRIEELRDFEEVEQRKYLCPNEECKKKTYWTPPTQCPKCHRVGIETEEVRMKAKRRQGTQVHRDLLALQEVAEETQPIYVPPHFAPRSTDSGASTANQQGLLSLQVAAQNRLKEISYFKRPTEEHKKEKENAQRLLTFLSTFLEYRRLQKLRTTYTVFPTATDGRVHAEWLIHGTATGRLSCSEPNLMQIPKREKRIRKIFVAADGKAFVSADYQNLEIHVLAHESKDEVLEEILAAGTNLHDHNTQTLFHIEKGDPKWDLARSAAKTFQFGGVQYLGGDREVYEQVILRAPELGLTFAEYKQAKANFMRAHPAYAKWVEETTTEAKRTRTAETFVGGKRFLTATNIRDVEKQSVNTPIQGGAAHVINRAMIAIDREVEEGELPFDLVLQVHDQLVYEVPVGRIEEAVALVRRHMEAPVDFRGNVVRFPVDIEIGLDWGSLEPYSKEALEKCQAGRR